MSEPNVLKQVQLEAAERPFRMVRGGLAGWLLVGVLTGPSGAALAAPNLWILGFLVGLRLAGAAMRRSHRAGLALGLVVLAIGSLPYAVAASVGRATDTTVAFFVAVILALALSGPSSLRALRDLDRYGDLPRQH